ncbi:hypothetical protein BCR33DRAFT_785343 [Rhizoclosmatium globosum]|uniref:Uncharacterized protein n=1 Tax=Rhizoclosmatium globosum TaxID=329046 RepID=A0A1Y2CAP1_9FUNG|nr:hypothetical protein BCR33DRAFT_785343 [Rhizoclosmatium globosum]|eukprot:ORY44102.1 hypothetical protein BCR33DRAFT_785343 [Rhizoclosmatium globosum]
MNVWYTLVGHSGEPAFDYVSNDRVKISSESIIADLRESILEKNKNHKLKQYDASDLKVFLNKNDVTDLTKMLKASSPVMDKGKTEDTLLYVVVPNPKNPVLLPDDIIDRILSAIPARVREGFIELNETPRATSISSASPSFRENLLKDLDILTADFVIPRLSQYLTSGNEAFVWQNSEEDSPVNKNAYLSFIREKFGEFFPLQIYDGDLEDSSLETSFNDEFSLKGNADCLISSTDAPARSVNNCHVLFELRKPSNKDMKLKQTELELLAADSISSYPVLAVVTDLMYSWKILWIQNRSGRKVLCSSQNLDIDLAIGLIQGYLKAVQQMLDRCDFELQPVDFVDEDVDEFDSNQGKKRKHKSQDTSRYNFSAVKLKDIRNQRTYEDADPEMDRDDDVKAMIRSFIQKNRAVTSFE